MKKTTFKIFILLAAAALLGVASAAQPRYLSSPGAREYPDTDVIVLSEKVSLTLMPDGRVEESRFRAEKVLTYQGIDTIGDPKVAFDTKSQKLVIDKCTTFSPDGRVTEAQKNSFTEMTPFELEKSPDYTTIRQMVVTKVGMELGSVIEFGYTLSDTKPWRKYLQGGFLLQNEYPTLEKEITIKVPKGTAFKFASEAKVEVSEEPGYTVYRALLKDLRALNFHEFGNREEFLYPFLAYSTAPDWSAQASRLSALFGESASKKSKALEDKANELAAKKLTLREKILSIHEFVTTKMNHVEWGADAFDYSPRNAGRIFETSYGHKIDMAALFCAMLGSIGVKGEPWLVMNGPFGDDSARVPSLALFDDVITVVEADGETLYLSSSAPASEASLRDWTGSRALKAAPGVTTLTVVPGLSKENAVKCAFSLDPKEKAVMKGTGSVVLTGGYANYESARNGIDGEIKPFVTGVLPDADEIKVTAKKISGDELCAEVEFTIDLAKAAGKTGFAALLMTSLPDASIVNANHFAGREKRSSPMILKMKGDESYEITVRLPEGYPKEANRLVSFSNQASPLKTSQGFKSENGKITVNYSVSAGDQMVTAEKYGSCRQAAVSLLAIPARMLILEEAKKK